MTLLEVILWYAVAAVICSGGYLFGGFYPDDLKGKDSPPLGMAPIAGFAWPLWVFIYMCILPIHDIDRIEKWRGAK